MSNYTELVGRPISRTEALRIAVEILELAEQERSECAASEETQPANARLIAAAPDLAEALRSLYDFQNGCPLPKYEEQWNKAMELAKAALEKAGV